MDRNMLGEDGQKHAGRRWTETCWEKLDRNMLGEVGQKHAGRSWIETCWEKRTHFDHLVLLSVTRW
jgi:hypothetical protein